MSQHTHIAVIGSGFGGLAAAYRLTRTGERDLLIFEQATSVGGTWRDNTYPGCACDVPSLLYSFSFAPNPTWTRSYSPQPEIRSYLEHCVDRFGLRDRLRLQHRVDALTWDGERDLWQVETSRGTWTADIVISATGPLSAPSIPDIPGLHDFTGELFHSARWNHEHDLTGRRVAVIGTGASAIQFVPEIQRQVARLTVFQRTAPWVMPRRDRARTPRELTFYRKHPVAGRAGRAGQYLMRELLVFGLQRPWSLGWQEAISRRHLAAAVKDPQLRAKLTPRYTIGCKRILISNTYYPALAAGNVDVVTDPITRVGRRAVVTADGAQHEVDTIIQGTGFHATETPWAARVRGRGGRTLAEAWDGSPTAYLGITVPDFPNLFLVLGPNTGLGHTSVVVMAEAQAGHIARVVRRMRRTRTSVVEPTPQALDAFVAEVDQRLRGTVWTSGGCESWYLDRAGRASSIWPSFTISYRRRLRSLDAAAYRWRRAGSRPAVRTPVMAAGAQETPSRKRDWDVRPVD